MRKPPNETPDQCEKRHEKEREISRRYRLKHPIHTIEQIEKRHWYQRAYCARKLARDPEGYRKAQRDASRRSKLKNPGNAKAATKKYRMANKPRVNEGRRRSRANNIVQALIREARYRAKRRGIEFTITKDDIPTMGKCCPLLGYLFPPPQQRATPFSPSLDRINSSMGYVKGNVWIVGRRANMIKNDGTADEHEMIAHAMRDYVGRL